MIANLLGVAGTDVPIEEIQKLMIPHMVSVCKKNLLGAEISGSKVSTYAQLFHHHLSIKFTNHLLIISNEIIDVSQHRFKSIVIVNIM